MRRHGYSGVKPGAEIPRNRNGVDVKASPTRILIAVV